MNNDSVVKAQWKAAIDFKWIRDNKVALEENMKNRNSNANLELVLDLYESMQNLLKVRLLSYILYPLQSPFHLSLLFFIGGSVYQLGM